MKFLFISGSHKSGTSWLAHMVNAHPSIKIPREELWLFGEPDSVSRSVRRSLHAWSQLPTVKYLLNDDPALVRATINSSIRGAVRGAITATLGDLSGIRVVGDKTPYYYAINVEELQEIYPDAFYIHVVRDPRDVIVSHHYHAYRLAEWDFFGDREMARANSELLQAGGDLEKGMLDHFATSRLAVDWLNVQLGSRRARELFPGRYFECRYEDLIVYGSTIISSIFDFLEEPISSDQCNEIFSTFSFQNMSSGRKAGEADNKSFFRKGIVGDWKNHFTSDNLRVVRAVCGQIATDFGYLEWHFE